MPNWKTTLAGLATGLLLALANYAGPNTWQGYLAALGPVAIGILSKDFNVTGGTVPNTLTPGPAEIAAQKTVNTRPPTP